MTVYEVIKCLSDGDSQEFGVENSENIIYPVIATRYLDEVFSFLVCFKRNIAVLIPLLEKSMRTIAVDGDEI